MTWFMWILAVFITMILFLNFIIAVISESYEKTMQKSRPRSFKSKVAMINERESQLTEYELQNDEYFPRYLVMRCMAS
jgi:hypothetical protein